MTDSPLVRLDLNNPIFLDGLAKAEPAEVSRILKGLLRSTSMKWQDFQKSKGIRWEELPVPSPKKDTYVHSMRLSKKYRLTGYRDGDFLRLLGVHLDHDSAYK